MEITGITKRGVGAEETFVTITLTPLDVALLRDECESQRYRSPLLRHVADELNRIMAEAMANLARRSVGRESA